MERACRQLRTKAFAVSGNDIGRRKRHKLIHIKSRRVDNILFYKKVMYLDDKRIRFIKPITAFCFLSANAESSSDITVFDFSLQESVPKSVVFNKFVVVHYNFLRFHAKTNIPIRRYPFWTKNSKFIVTQ